MAECEQKVVLPNKSWKELINLDSSKKRDVANEYVALQMPSNELSKKYCYLEICARIALNDSIIIHTILQDPQIDPSINNNQILLHAFKAYSLITFNSKCKAGYIIEELLAHPRVFYTKYVDNYYALRHYVDFQLMCRMIKCMKPPITAKFLVNWLYDYVKNDDDYKNSPFYVIREELNSEFYFNPTAHVTNELYIKMLRYLINYFDTIIRYYNTSQHKLCIYFAQHILLNTTENDFKIQDFFIDSPYIHKELILFFYKNNLLCHLIQKRSSFPILSLFKKHVRNKIKPLFTNHTNILLPKLTTLQSTFLLYMNTHTKRESKSSIYNVKEKDNIFIQLYKQLFPLIECSTKKKPQFYSTCRARLKRVMYKSFRQSSKQLQNILICLPKDIIILLAEFTYPKKFIKYDK